MIFGLGQDANLAETWLLWFELYTLPQDAVRSARRMHTAFTVEKQKSITKVLLVQSAGFLVIIALSWFDELIDLRSLILGDHPYISDFRESALEMLLVLAVWFVVAGATRRLIRRVYYLEGFARVCAWCRHISFKGSWVRLEEFLEEGFDTPTTHSMCPNCVRAQKAAIEAARNAARERSIQGGQPEPGAVS